MNNYMRKVDGAPLWTAFQALNAISTECMQKKKYDLAEMVKETSYLFLEVANTIWAEQGDEGLKAALAVDHTVPQTVIERAPKTDMPLLMLSFNYAAEALDAYRKDGPIKSWRGKKLEDAVHWHAGIAKRMTHFAVPLARRRELVFESAMKGPYVLTAEI